MCGIRNAQHIPAIWLVIQASKGKSFDSYRTHLAKSIDACCLLHHIDCNKSLFFEAKFFEDLVALRFNPGGAVAQFHSAARGMSILACWLLMAAEAEHCCKYKEAAVNATYTQSLDELLKRNRGRTVAPAPSYMDLKLDIRMYCGLLWLLFGDYCDY